MKIDATDKVLGRLASEIAIFLQGKNSPNFKLENDSNEKIEIINVGKIRFTGKKMENKVYYRHSGYPGGLKKIILKDLFAKDPKEVIKKAVLGMLPKNKLRQKRIKRLIIKD